MKKSYIQPKFVIELLTVQDVMWASTGSEKFVVDSWYSPDDEGGMF